MPAYDFRCNTCGEDVSLVYKSVTSYAKATPTCTHCQSDDLERVIRKVNVASVSRDYTQMDATEMLNVFESGDSKQVGKMFDQIGGTNPALGAEYHEATKRLMRGESMDNVESSLQKKRDAKDAKSNKSNSKK
ncbi:MAG: zinc ribbon domain-containing protein [Chloroflexota bacterium]